MEFPPMSPGIPRISPPWIGAGGGVFRVGAFIQMTSAYRISRAISIRGIRKVDLSTNNYVLYKYLASHGHFHTYTC